MGINGIGTAEYPATGYQTRKAESSAESGSEGDNKEWRYFYVY